MSKRRVLGKSTCIVDQSVDQSVDPSLKLEQEEQPKYTTYPKIEQEQNLNDKKTANSTGELICPICNQHMKTLIQLNRHVDRVHLNIQESAETENQNDLSDNTSNTPTLSPGKSHSRNSSSISSSKKIAISPVNGHSTKTQNIIKLPRDHFLRSGNGTKCMDPRCHNKVGLKNGAINCSKCGKIYCLKHCHIPLKLNSKLEIVNEKFPDAIWSKCCLQCLNEYPGWNNVISSAFIYDKTDSFKRFRKLKIESESLEKLVLERRVERLYNWIIKQLEISGKINEFKLREFEHKLVEWQPANDISNCPICQVSFSLFNRKHHCRICGDVVCGNAARGCSMVVPIGILCDLMQLDNNGKSLSHERIHELLKIDLVGIRICLTCKKRVFNERIFKLDQLKSEQNEFMQFYKIWKILFDRLEKEDITKIDSDEQNMILVNMFTRLDKLIKQIEQEILENNLTADKLRMLNTLKSAIVNYIQEKLPILRKAQEQKLAREREVLQELIDGRPKLSKREIREKREKLMVLNEQKFLVGNMYEESKRQRQFDDLKTLDENLADIEKEIEELTIELGDEAFH